MSLSFDQNLFTQVNLDSGSLTMLGTIVHSFAEPGEYRGSVHKAGGEQAVFYITVDKDSAVAHADIDLASLPDYSGETKNDCCDESLASRFTVNPKGYAVFHVTHGGSGFSVRVRRATEDPKEPVFNSEQLGEGDTFAASIIRPGTYTIVNRLTQARAEVTVSYPVIGKTPYRPPEPVRVQVGPKTFEPASIQLKPGQGLLFDCKAPARIVIELAKPDDGPGQRQTPPRGWSRQTLPKRQS